MQALHQDFDQSQQGLTNDHPVLREMTTEQVVAHVQAVPALRQRVAELETQLAAIRGSQVVQSPTALRKPPPLTAIDFTPPCPPSRSAIATASDVPVPPALPVPPVPARADAPIPTSHHERIPAAHIPQVSASVAPPRVIVTSNPAPTGPAASAPPALSVSQFTASKAPAVAPVSNPGFAEAWAKETSAEHQNTSEQTSAEQAFFDATSVDEESRSWLLNG